MDFLEKHFDEIDQFIDDEKKEKEGGKKEESCCEKKENYLIEDDIIKCKVCLNTISNISSNPEWRYYGTSDNKSGDPTRCGMPVNTLLPESSVGSTVSYKTNTKTMNQIRKYQQWNGMPYKERSLYKVFLTIQEICTKHNLPNIIINEAKSLYKITSSTKISRGSNRNGIIAACVYFSCKLCHVPRSSKEIAEMFSIDSTVMTKGVKKCQEIINMNKKYKLRLNNTTSIKPHDFIERFCNKLNISQQDMKIIQKICDISVKNNIICENTPQSIAAGCIFYFSKLKNLPITKKEISLICIISEVTINKCSKKLEENKKLFAEVVK